MSAGWKIAALSTLAGIGVVAWLGLQEFTRIDTEPVVLSDAPVPFEVRPGEGASSVLARLDADGLLVSSRAWDLWVRINAPGGCLQAGPHEIPANATADALFASLCQVALAPSIRVTVPEGTNVYQLADRLAEAGLGDRERYVALAFDPAFIDALGIAAPSLEGYLGPDTYDFDEEASERAVLTRLAEHGASVRAALGPPTGPAATLSEHELLTVASIVEEEAQVAEERPIIARVIYNRLARGMQIQCDPTCVYGPDTYDQVPTRALCRDPSSTHSTYVVPALPPTPISNPGRAAIEAALHPAEDPDVLYFVAIGDGSGRHVFADTLAAHNANVDRYIRGR